MRLFFLETLPCLPSFTIDTETYICIPQKVKDDESVRRIF
ncbi:hypothetical protein MNBD_DELTA04-1388 [hydrothermal vent metagenome]|uniref:Uncharacterized protein n=1 Tax=hydrothermal vent metagenome TaxID=652676 RepID=A0A3B0V582_9ZZZZ